MIVFVTTQMRTGSTWLCDLLSGIVGMRWSFWERGRDIPQEKFRDFIHDAKGNHIIKMHYTPPKRICECIEYNDKKNFVISITRDVRDIAISKILYMKNDRPMRNLARLKNLNNMRVQFDRKHLSDKDYINTFITTPHFKHIVRNWKLYNDGYTHPNYHLTSYELLHKRRLFVCRTLTNFLNVKRANNKLKLIIGQNNFLSKTGRTQGKAINTAFRRKGIVGDHLNYLNQKSKRIINRLVEKL